MTTASSIYTPDDLRDLPTLCQGQCCNLKIDDGKRRVWLCRVAGGVTIEAYRNGRWTTVAGNCDDVGDDQ